MMTNDLSKSLKDSLSPEFESIISNAAELGIDALLEDGVLKDIPFISSAISIYRIEKSIKERHNLKKLICFLDELNKCSLDENNRNLYAEKFQQNEKFQKQQLDYIMILVDRYLDYNKPRMLAKLYLAYLFEYIDWQMFSTYAEIIDRLLPDDITYLMYAENLFVVYEGQSDGIEPLLRLEGLGIITEDQQAKNRFIAKPTRMVSKKIPIPAKVNSYYAYTDLGTKLRKIMKSENICKLRNDEL